MQFWNIGSSTALSVANSYNVNIFSYTETELSMGQLVCIAVGGQMTIGGIK
jgi:hypothetical protein